MLKHGWKRGGDRIVRQEYSKWAMEENIKDSYKRLETVVKVKDKDVKPISTLQDMFENILVEDLIKFKSLFPQHTVPVTLSETLRTKEDQAKTLLEKWKAGTLTKTYKKTPLYYTMEKKTYDDETLTKALLQCTSSSLKQAVKIFFNEPNDQNAYDIFFLTASSEHMKGDAVDVSGHSSYHSFQMKQDLVEFLNTRNRYTIFLYIGRNAAYTAEGGKYFLYGYDKNIPKNIKTPHEVFSDLKLKDSNWFFHVQLF